MIIRNKFQFRGAIRITLGLIGFVLMSLALWKAVDDGLEAYVYGLPIVVGVLASFLLVSGLRARCRLPMYRLDQNGFHCELEADLPKEIRWQDVIVVRHCGDALTLVSNNGEANSFDLKESNQRIETIVAECLAHFRRSNGLAPVRDSVIAAPPALCCQVCGVSTENLKAGVSFVILFAYMFAWVWRKQSMACPKCTRKNVYKLALINLLSANLIWPIVVVPICLIQWVSSFRTGHSRAVIDALEARAIKELTA